MSPPRDVLWVGFRNGLKDAALRAAMAARGYRVSAVDTFDGGDKNWEREGDVTRTAFRGMRGLTIDTAFIRGLRKLIKERKPQLIQTDAGRRLISHVLLAASGSQIPVIVERGAIRGLNVLNPVDWLNYFGSGARVVLCPSQAMVRALRAQPLVGSLLTRKLVSCPHQIILDESAFLSRDEARAALGLSRDAFVVGAVCNIRPIKNIPVVAAAVSRLRAAFPIMRLAVIGDQSDAPEVARIAAVSDPDAVIFLGPRPSAWRYFRAFDALVSPTLPPGEGFGLTVAEAMLAGIPVVTSEHGAAPEVAGEGGLIVAATDITAWENAISALAKDPGRRAALGIAGRARALHTFSTQAVAQRLGDIY
ncbi:MAG: glycosyltransferase family 4 protein, partial [Pseudolabrys sp.]|nr:glycosyltransferase family 4 protein [Pseudolabrys sp.]